LKKVELCQKDEEAEKGKSNKNVKPVP